MSRGEPPRLVVLLSGGGTTLENIMERIEAGKLRAQVVLVVSSKEGVKGIARAQKRGIPTEVVPSARYREGKRTDWTAFSREVSRVVMAAEPDLVLLAGFMCFFQLPPALESKVMNIHPALIPAFAGHNMYGEKVHEAVVQRGAKVSGCTVHFVTNEYDAGPIIVQRVCQITSEDSADAVASKVFREECEAYPEAIRLFLDGRLAVKDGIVHIAPAPEPVRSPPPPPAAGPVARATEASGQACKKRRLEEVEAESGEPQFATQQAQTFQSAKDQLAIAQEQADARVKQLQKDVDHWRRKFECTNSNQEKLIEQDEGPDQV